MSNAKQIRPRVLYHASPRTNIMMLQPRAERIRMGGEGAVVFATPDKAFSSMFITPTDDSWTSKGQYNGVYTCVISDLERYQELDQGGAIYSLSSETFETDPSKGMGINEWVSKKAVIPLGKELYRSGLEAMISLGVEVYVLKEQEFQEFLALKKEQKYEESYQFLKKISTPLT